MMDDLAPRENDDLEDGSEVVDGEHTPSAGHRGNHIIQIQRGFSGPLPPPEMLAQYEAVLSGGADRIVKMAEDQSSHRRRLESRGQIFGFSLALVAILGGIGLILDGRSAEGLVPLIGALAGLVGLFIYGEVRAHRARQIEPRQDSNGDD